MPSTRTARRVLEIIISQHPEADTELRFRTAFELVVATILSAQTTDARVNLVTPALFARFPNADSLARAHNGDVETLIASTGFFRPKARALIGMSQTLVDQFSGEVPANMEALVQLPGVGRKTANVVLGHAFGLPGLPVDRHVIRVTNRLGLVDTDDPVGIEQRLYVALPASRWTLASDALIQHGRRVCRPTPRCDECDAVSVCAFNRQTAHPPSGKTVRVGQHVPQRLQTAPRDPRRLRHSR